MIALEKTLSSRYPAWFAGHRAKISRPLIKTLEKFSKFDEINAFLTTNAHLTGFSFIEAALAHLDARYTVDQVERERIPVNGRVLIIANHPSGALDALALLHFIGSIRRDVKIVANDMLGELDGIRELLLPVNILGGKPHPDSLRAIEQALETEQCVIVFPAGEVSRLSWKGISDSQWRRGFLRFAKKTSAPVLPVKIQARNSAFFYGASLLHKPIGTALLPREVFSRRGSRIGLRIGLPMNVEQQGESTFDLRSIRQALYAIGSRKENAAPGQEPLVHPVERARLLGDLKAMTMLGQTPDGKKIYCGRLRSDAPLLREIGRLRELSFRAVGEGTGKKLDVDAFDTWYEHIVLWDANECEIAGAYRVARGDDVYLEKGREGFYTASLFKFPCEVMARLAEGMELGRSFVTPKYWNSRSLDYLWIGIGAYLKQYPEIRYLFGPVSMSAAIPIAAREQMVAYYQTFYGDAKNNVVANHPFRYLANAPTFVDLDAEASFKCLKANLDALGARVPTLYKQYTELCEPGGARFLGFGVDPDFNNSVDGLIEVDLHKILPKKRERYLGIAAAQITGKTSKAA
ncbi:MAG: lysophospholipid acyltransferase family protein [Arenimonas sp.]